MDRPLPALDPQSHTWLALDDVQRLLVDALPGVAMVLQADGRIRSINAAGAQRLGYDVDELQGRELVGSLVTDETVQARAAELPAADGEGPNGDGSPLAGLGVLAAPLWNTPDGKVAAQAWTLRQKDGAPLQLRLGVAALRDHRGQATGLLLIESPEAGDDDAMPRFAHHDSLTGLPARSVLPDRMEMAIQRAARQKTVLALMRIDVTGFDALCREHGQSVGDDVLRATAGRLNFELRKTDTAVRLDHGEFAAMLVDLHHADEAVNVATKVQQSLSRPVNVGVAVVPVKARVGVAWFPDHGDQLLHLMQAAESALETASEGGQPGIAAIVPAR